MGYDLMISIHFVCLFFQGSLIIIRNITDRNQKLNHQLGLERQIPGGIERNNKERLLHSAQCNWQLAPIHVELSDSLSGMHKCTILWDFFPEWLYLQSRGL